MASLGLRRHAAGEDSLPLACLPGAIDSQPPMDGDGVAPYEPDFLRAPCSPPPDSASTPTVSGDCLYGISPALKLRLQRSRSFRRRHPSSCKRALSIHKCSQSPAPPFTHIALFMRRSVFYSLAHFVAHLVARYFPLSIPAPTLPRCASIHTWMRLHGWRFSLL